MYHTGACSQSWQWDVGIALICFQSIWELCFSLFTSKISRSVVSVCVFVFVFVFNMRERERGWSQLKYCSIFIQVRMQTCSKILVCLISLIQHCCTNKSSTYRKPENGFEECSINSSWFFVYMIDMKWRCRNSSAWGWREVP